MIEPMPPRSIDPASQEAVAQRLRAFRQAKGLIQAAFARSCGMTPQHIWNYEVGGQMPSVAMAHQIAAAHGIDFNFIFQGALRSLDDDIKVKFQELMKNPREPSEPEGTPGGA